ncbi:MAG: acetylornithine transaminase [Bacilli bacterium]
MTHVFETYARWTIEPVSAQGSVLIDKDGKTYLDFTSGIAVCNLGHNHPHVVAALHDQIDTLWHTSNLFQMPLQEEVATKLVKDTHLSRVFFCNSGAEANEAAIKLARRASGKHRIISFQQSFHGRTFATMTATGQEKIYKGFGPLVSEFVHVPYNDFDAFLSAVNAETAAVMLEIVQGEGGVRPADREWLESVAGYCKAHGIYIIVDEVQTGIGRTGTRYAFEQYGIQPDIVTLAKGLGNGFPVGAMMATEPFASVFTAGVHGTTFGGTPLAMRVASSVLDVAFDQAFLQEVAEKGVYLAAKLQELAKSVPQVVQIRGMGLMWGIELSGPVKDVITALQGNGLLVLMAGENVLRLLPSLTVTTEQIDEAVAKIEQEICSVFV